MKWISIVALCCLAGCSVIRPSPTQTDMASFENADRIVVNGHEITDVDTISGLHNIYRHAKWRPFFSDVPLWQVSIEVYQGESLLLKFRYCREGYLLMDESRKGIINDNQQEWIYNNVWLKVPEYQRPMLI